MSGQNEVVVRVGREVESRDVAGKRAEEIVRGVEMVDLHAFVMDEEEMVGERQEYEVTPSGESVFVFVEAENTQAAIEEAMGVLDDVSVEGLTVEYGGTDD